MSSNASSEPLSRTGTPGIIAQQRFTSQAQSAEELLAGQTVGLVALSDFRKRRAEANEAKERVAQDSFLGLSRKQDTPDASTPGNSDGTVKRRSQALR